MSALSATSAHPGVSTWEGLHEESATSAHPGVSTWALVGEGLHECEEEQGLQRTGASDSSKLVPCWAEQLVVWSL